VIGPLYDSDQKASAALKLLPANSPLMESRRKQPKAQSETDNITAQALDLLVEQLDDMKGPSQSGESAEVSTNKIALTAGQVLSRTTAGTSQTTYHIAVPDNFNPEKPPPLLVVFSPGGDGRGMMNQVRASANTVGWMVIGCDKLKNGMSDEDAFPIERDLIRDFRTLIPYDQTRLYYGGFSGGASRAYHLTYRFKDPCAGILAFGGWLGGVEEQKKRFQKNMAIAMVNGDTDPGACSWEEADKTALKRRRCEVKIFHFPGGHAVAPSKVIDEAIAWLDTQAGTIGSKSKLPGK
jgi:predicted peptidase